MSKKIPWPQEALDKLQELFPIMEAKDVALHLGISLGRVNRKAYAIGLRKSADYQAEKMKVLLESGAASRYSKGNTPHNKGEKMPESTYQKVKRTFFKKGQKSHNEKPVGFERFGKDDYIEVKTPKGYKMKHRHIWEQHFGQIPPSHIIAFKDGNKYNFQIENLQLMSRGDNAIRNHRSKLAAYPAEYKETILLIVKIEKLLYAKK